MTTPAFDPQPCTGADGSTIPCPEPQLFHTTTTSTGPVDHPGRQYDITLPINPGFAVQSLQVDSVTHAANIVWEVDDRDGETFRQNLTTFIEGRIPAEATVTITNPNAGQSICGVAAPMQVHIECIRLDQEPPDLIELIYNGGQDMVINPAYNETPPLNPPVSQGNYGYHLLARQDDPGPFPGNPPAGRADCTNTANRGWETNDVGRTFEIWGQDVATGVTPTPRGTPVQEITSDGPPPGGTSTIWQTFQAPASGNFIIRVVHGARDAGETHRITLDNGDTDDAQNGTLINDVSTPPTVYGNPWTTFSQTIPLVGGSTYTLALSTTNPVGGARGGLFTDMRAYIDRPDQRATAATDDDTCVVTVDETTTVCDEQMWAPTCTDGTITSWTNPETGQTLDNASFWGQAPAPTPGPCPATAGDGDGGSVAANLVHTYTVCAEVGGVLTNLQRVVITDASGGVLADSFIGPDGGPVTTPSSYSIGSCTDTAFVNDVVLCDVTPTGAVPFLRKFVQTIDSTNQGQVISHRDFELDGAATYTVTGIVSDCTEVIADRETVCWTDSNSTPGIHTGTIRHQDGVNAQGWLLFDQNQVLVGDTSGVTFVSCAEAMDPIAINGLCLPGGIPIAVVVRRNSVTGAVATDGWIRMDTGAFTAGNPPVGTVACGDSSSVQVSGTFCSVDTTTNEVLALILIEYTYNPDGTIASTRLVNAVDGTTYTVPAGAEITTCPTGEAPPDADLVVLCDNNGPFLRDYRRDASAAVTNVSDYTLSGVPYTTVGAVGSCAGRDQEILVLCDSATTPVRFLRRYNYNLSTGALVSVVDTTLDGTTPFTPTGAVGVCAQTVQSDTDFVEEILCSTSGGVVTPFIRLFRFNSATGALISTTNTTLAGAAFTPATVGLCSDCCPQVIADELCTNTGSGRATAIRADNGTVTLIDSVSGATITAANIITCPTDDVVQTLTSQARVLTNAAPWTPGTDVTGTLTSLTVTGTVGLWDMVDANGTVLTNLPAGLSMTWEAEDNNTLTGPQSVTPQVGSTVVANWTQR